MDVRRGLARIVPGYAGLVDQLQQTRDRLDAAQRASSAAKTRIASLEAREERLRARVRRLEAAARARKASSAAQKLSAGVLEETAAIRRAALTSSSRVGAARMLEEAFLTRSNGYRGARDSHAYLEYECDGPALVHGLEWWVPRQPGTDPDSREARLVRGRLSLHSILAARELAQGTIMLDIGANIGTTSIPRVVLGDFQTVYAAEPEPANYACLVQNVVANGLAGFVLPDRVAIGASAGDVQLEVTDQIGNHRIIPAAGSGPVNDSPGRRVTVPCRTLDGWIESLGIDPGLVAFIKCDVEGWEPQVLAGACRTLRHRHIAWQLEVSPKNLDRSRSTVAELCAHVRSHFNRFIDMRGESGRGRPTSEIEAALAPLVTERRYTDILVYNT